MDADLLTTDRNLLLSFRQGDREALIAVWRFYYPMVRNLAVRTCCGMTGHAATADVDDAVSATFLAAFQEGARLSYDGVTPFGAYLLGIGRNVIRRQISKACREPAIEPASIDWREDSDPSPEDVYLTREETEVLSRFPQTLRNDEREVFFAHYRDGLSEESLADSLGRTRYRIRKILALVERRLRRYLKEHGIE